MRNTRPADFLAWAVDVFGPVAKVPIERAARFIEEAIELVHAMGLSRAVLIRIVDRVYGGPAGDRLREFGQAQVTLELLAENDGVALEVAAESEWQRVRAIPKEIWVARHSIKIAGGIADENDGDAAAADFTERRCERHMTGGEA